MKHLSKIALAVAYGLQCTVVPLSAAPAPKLSDELQVVDVGAGAREVGLLPLGVSKQVRSLMSPPASWGKRIGLLQKENYIL